MLVLILAESLNNANHTASTSTVVVTEQLLLLDWCEKVSKTSRLSRCSLLSKTIRSKHAEPGYWQIFSFGGIEIFKPLLNMVA